MRKVLTRRQLLQAIVGLIEVSDYGLLSQDAVLGEMADPADFSRIREIAGMVKRFYDEFDYTQSMEYRASVQGKSAAYEEVSQRMASDAKKAATHRARLGMAFLELPATTELQSLLPAAVNEDLAKLARSVSALRNPG